MVEDLKTYLLRILDESYVKTMRAALALDSGTVIYPDTGWRVKDVIGHLAAWDIAITRSLEAYSNGGEYRNPTDGETFNQEEYNRRASLDAGPIYAEYAVARAGLKAAVSAVPTDRLDGTMLAAWGARGGVRFVIEDTLGHESEHQQALQNHVQQQTTA